ncbi:hypothetical protein CgunFtcFv8_006589 [Champsocephalus gunnari]|uniref:Uncharacterized protein n=1 Tax=Champsocephalus gunnari TaxID=52237 RepID=A0AAN8BYH3_CHAGU|nr:hypothetical protein CgunFtcFv8_006589 [Champsocephalus gunnari]
MKKRNNRQSTESEARLSTPSTANAEGYQDASSLHYAAVSVNVPNRLRRQRNIPNDEFGLISDVFVLGNNRSDD